MSGGRAERLSGQESTPVVEFSSETILFGRVSGGEVVNWGNDQENIGIRLDYTGGAWRGMEEFFWGVGLIIGEILTETGGDRRLVMTAGRGVLRIHEDSLVSCWRGRWMRERLSYVIDPKKPFLEEVDLSIMKFQRGGRGANQRVRVLCGYDTLRQTVSSKRNRFEVLVEGRGQLREFDLYPDPEENCLLIEASKTRRSQGRQQNGSLPPGWLERRTAVQGMIERGRGGKFFRAPVKTLDDLMNRRRGGLDMVLRVKSLVWEGTKPVWIKVWGARLEGISPAKLIFGSIDR